MAAGVPAARVRAGPESRRGHLVAAQAVHGQLRRRRPGRPGPDRQAQAEEDPVPPPPDRRLPGRHRPENRTLVTTCTTSSACISGDQVFDDALTDELRSVIVDAGQSHAAAFAGFRQALGDLASADVLRATRRDAADDFEQRLLDATDRAYRLTVQLL